jgi:hypothetical protein
VAVAVVGVAVALGVAFLVANLASRGDVDVRLGDDRFEAGQVDQRAETVAEGGPILFPDPANFRRSIYVDHQGDDPEDGWVAFGAFVPGQPDCAVEFLPDEGIYVVVESAGCDGSMTFPRSGEGLREFPTEVVEGELFVDLQEPAAD